jgi:hypothetical protein
MTRLRYFSIIFISILFFTSCKKKGCTDVNADNYDSQAEKSSTCLFRYGKTVSVFTPSSVNYDPIDEPDLYIRFSKSSSSQWDYATTVVNNSYTLTASFNNEFLFTNEQWDYEIYDQDTFDSDDLVCSGSFNPLKDGSNGKIDILNGSVVIQFPYSVKQ